MVATRRTDLIAAILSGSVARRQERPLTARRPSDVDVLLVFDTDEVLGYTDRIPIFEALVREMCVYPDAPREVQVMFATRTLAEWLWIWDPHAPRWERFPTPLTAPWAGCGSMCWDPQLTANPAGGTYLWVASDDFYPGSNATDALYRVLVR